MIRIPKIRALLLCTLTLILTACGGGSDGTGAGDVPTVAPPTPPGNIVEVASENGSFSTLLAAADAAGLVDALSDESASLTLFAPTDAAFNALPDGVVDALLADPDALANVLTYHVIGSTVSSVDATNLAGSTVEMLNGGKAALTLRHSNLYINESLITVANIEASNGIIHVIDAVMVPPDLTPSTSTIAEIAVADGRFETLVTAATAADLVGVLADPDATLTVFAPTDEAFAMLGENTINALLLDLDRLTNVLLYHVLTNGAVDSIAATAAYQTSITMANGDEAAIDIADGMLMINGSNVVIKDIVASNGIIHVIDAVLAPPSAGPGTIVEVAAANGSFTTLLTAVQVAGLTGALLDPTADLTVFAPTDEAFTAIDSAVLESLLQDQAALTDVLTYHLYQGQVDSTTALGLDGSDVEMLNGDTVSISVDDGKLFINDAQVIIADVQANNGIIHVIDAVLIPPVDPPGTIAEVATANGSFDTLLTAVEAAGLTDALNDPLADLTVFAPTDAAFAAIDPEALNALLDDVPALTNVLQYHLLAGQVDSATALTLDGQSVEMANGDLIDNSVIDGNLFVNDSQVTIADVPASNGVIHVIDAVLFPPGN